MVMKSIDIHELRRLINRMNLKPVTTNKHQEIYFKPASQINAKDNEHIKFEDLEKKINTTQAKIYVSGEFVIITEKRPVDKLCG